MGTSSPDRVGGGAFQQTLMWDGVTGQSLGMTRLPVRMRVAVWAEMHRTIRCVWGTADAGTSAE